jgi:hypothetical protein
MTKGIYVAYYVGACKFLNRIEQDKKRAASENAALFWIVYWTLSTSAIYRR